MGRMQRSWLLMQAIHIVATDWWWVTRHGWMNETTINFEVFWNHEVIFQLHADMTSVLAREPKHIESLRALSSTMWLRVALQKPRDVSEECNITVFKVAEYANKLKGKNQTVSRGLLLAYLVYSSTLLKGVVYSSETSVSVYRTTQCHMPQDDNVRISISY
jgi:hypothetical protein